MYLLMLLATFISAIYGYNLSPRADYDRDVIRKKAMAMVYKFMFQEDAVHKVLVRVSDGDYQNMGLPAWVGPEDQVFADVKKMNDTTLYYRETNGTENPFYMREKGSGNQGAGAKNGEEDAKNYLGAGRHFYDGAEMVTKIICLKDGTDLTADGHAENCMMAVDEEGHVTQSCCRSSGRYMVTYKKIDARFINRIHRGVSFDFYSAIVKRPYTDNVGIILWDGHNWQFNGKITFEPVYAEDEREWNSQSEHQDEEGKLVEPYPVRLRERSTWTLPKDFFKEDYFINNQGKKICADGCLFKIRGF